MKKPDLLEETLLFRIAINCQAQYGCRILTGLELGQPDLSYQPLHTGIDIASPTGKVGDPIRTFMFGTVI